MRTLLIAILLVICSSTASIANNLKNDSTVTFITYWEKGDSYDFVMHKSKLKYSGDTLKSETNIYTDLSMSVVESTDTDYTISLTYGETAIEGDSNPVLLLLTSLTGGSEYQYKISEMGEFQELLNWQDIRDYIEKMVDTVKANIPDKQGVQQAFALITGLYDSKEKVEASAKSVQLYHAPYGMEYALNDKLSFESELPNPFGGNPIPAIYSLELTEINKEDGYCVLEITQTIDKVKAKEFVLDFVKKIMPALANKNEEELEDKIPVFEITDKMQFQMDLNSGWIVYCENIRSVVAGPTRQVETTSLSMQFDEEDEYDNEEEYLEEDYEAEEE